MNRFATLLIAGLAVCRVGAAEYGTGTAPASSAETAGATYVIGPGDVLQVFVLRSPELTVTVPVRPDGRISTPMVEDLHASGKTPAALARDVELELGKYLREPQVNIIVTQPAGVLSQVIVIGKVKQPQTLQYREGMRVLDAILAAGGVAEFAAADRTMLLRTENGKQEEIPVQLGQLLKKGDLKQNLALRPDDVLLVPESRF